MEVLKNSEVLQAEKGVVYCNKLFFLERQYKVMTPREKIKTSRNRDTDMGGNLGMA